MYYIQDPFAYVPLFWERLSMLLAELASFTQSNNLLLYKGRESDDDSFRLYSFELLDIDVAYRFVP